MATEYPWQIGFECLGPLVRRGSLRDRIEKATMPLHKVSGFQDSDFRRNPRLLEKFEALQQKRAKLDEMTKEGEDQLAKEVMDFAVACIVLYGNKELHEQILKN